MVHALLVAVLVSHVDGCVVDSLYCQCYYWSIPLFPITQLNLLLIVLLRYSFVLLVVSCYSCCMCFGEVLPLLPLPCKWWIGGSMHCCTPLIIGYPPSPFTPLVLFLFLLVCCVACAMVRFYPFPLPCASGGTFIWLKKGKICICL